MKVDIKRTHKNKSFVTAGDFLFWVSTRFLTKESELTPKGVECYLKAVKECAIDSVALRCSVKLVTKGIIKLNIPFLYLDKYYSVEVDVDRNKVSNVSFEGALIDKSYLRTVISKRAIKQCPVNSLVHKIRYQTLELWHPLRNPLKGNFYVFQAALSYGADELILNLVNDKHLKYIDLVLEVFNNKKHLFIPGSYTYRFIELIDISLLSVLSKDNNLPAQVREMIVRCLGPDVCGAVNERCIERWDISLQAKFKVYQIAENNSDLDSLRVLKSHIKKIVIEEAGEIE